MTPFDRRTARIATALVVASLVVAPRSSVRAQATAPAAAAVRKPSAEDFDRSEVQIPMRDGARLHTLIFSPKGTSGNLPIIFTRTPYGIASAGRTLGSSYAELADEGYIFVYQDIRGRFGSDGQFVMLRPMRDKADPKAIDESSDTYDTIEWLLRNVAHNNGRVGMLGVSYPGWLTVMAMLDPHPALKAVSPQASPADMFLGDDFHHNGAFRLSYGFEYAAAMESGKEINPFKFDAPDLYDWYLQLGSLAHVNERYLKGKVPTWNDYASHPNYDAFWRRQGVAKFLDRVRVPTLNVAGWWDQEDFYGPIKIYETLEPHDAQHRNYLVVGPWNHGGWSGASGRKLGDVDFGSETALEYRKNILAPWFAYWLKDKGTLTLAEATTFESGTNRWMSYDSWPPKKNVSPRRFYTGASGRLSTEPPNTASAQAFDAYVSDPANPVPYRQRPILPTFSGGGSWGRWLVDDQRFLKGRADVATWETPPLDADVVIAGAIKAHLLAATSGSDADWVVKLIDVYPDSNPVDPKLSGHALMVANDVLRARFRNSFEHPDSIVPNKVEPYVVDLHTQNYRFLKGHRIQMQVQSSWFPLIDRNPQTWVPNIFEAKDSDFKPATQRIYRSREAATYIELPVVAPALTP
jgi:putative CocE/NonD family hydrolase